MAMKAKHAFGALERVDENIKSGVIDSYDVLFVKDSDGKPYVGWISKDGQKEIVDPYAEVSKLETQVDEKLAAKADAESVTALETELANKIDATEVDKKISTAATDSVATANAYTNKVVEAAMDEHLTKKYEITDVPAGTLITYRENEIRICCPADSEWVKQAVGVGGDANSYYCTFKTYAPSDDAVGYIEHLGTQVDEEILTDFQVDEYGKRYQPSWLALAKYDESTDTWTYYGASSDTSRYMGWDYQINWFNADGVMIASDSIRINLSNEDCHSSIEPYYVSEVKTYVDTKIEEKLSEVESSYEIIEF